MAIFTFHLILHFAVPAGVTAAFFRQHWQKAYLFMLSAMLIDIDHILANPIFDPNRCSVGYHPLHEPLVLPIYFLLAGYSKTRYLGIGLLIHVLLDSVDCQITNGVWFI
ncbi:DUF6122 family protein [Gammaproteobacteria bacterium]|nr:DUF6122 family protein [Gammaproteobacteria bacterium]